VSDDSGASPLPRRAPGAGRGPGGRPLKRPALSESDLQRMRAALDSAHAQADAPPAKPPAPKPPAPLPQRAPDESNETDPAPSPARPELPASLLPTPRQAPLEPPPAVRAARSSPASRPLPAWLRERPSRGRAIIVGSAILTLVAILAGWSASSLAKHAGPARIRASAATGADVRDAAAAWVARQVSRAGLVSCDPVMCQALEASGVPATDLLVLRPGRADPLGSDVVVVTAAVTKMVGHRLLTADAPAAIASFGSGNRQIFIRMIYPRGADAYAAALRKEIAGRKSAGASLLLLGPVTASAAASQQLRDGQVDSRLLLTLAELASQGPVTITAFGDRASGASPGIPFRSADLMVTGGKAGPAPASQVARMSVFVHQLGGYFAAARIRTVHFAGGQDVVRIEFTAPGQFGLLGTPTQ
jgi:hypothetical protein